MLRGRLLEMRLWLLILLLAVRRLLTLIRLLHRAGLLLLHILRRLIGLNACVLLLWRHLLSVGRRCLAMNLGVRNATHRLSIRRCCLIRIQHRSA